MAAIEIDPTRRAETVAINEFVALARMMDRSGGR